MLKMGYIQTAIIWSLGGAFGGALLSIIYSIIKKKIKARKK